MYPIITPDNCYTKTVVDADTVKDLSQLIENASNDLPVCYWGGYGDVEKFNFDVRLTSVYYEVKPSLVFWIDENSRKTVADLKNFISSINKDMAVLHYKGENTDMVCSGNDCYGLCADFATVVNEEYEFTGLIFQYN